MTVFMRLFCLISFSFLQLHNYYYLRYEEPPERDAPPEYPLPELLPLEKLPLLLRETLYDEL